MKVSVIIPAVNEAELVPLAIRSAWRSGAAEVIVADGGSCDGTADRATAAGAQVVMCPPGRAGQQNRGARMAHGEVLLFLHADCQLPVGAANEIRTALGDPRVVAGAFRQQIDDPRMVYRAIEAGNAWRARWLGLAYGDQAVFVRQHVFWTVGGYDNAPILEDVRLSQRLRRKGHMILLPGPLLVSPRRWQREGVVRETLKNWSLLAAYFCGCPPRHLARFYPRHDQMRGGRRRPYCEDRAHRRG